MAYVTGAENAGNLKVSCDIALAGKRYVSGHEFLNRLGPHYKSSKSVMGI